jgi:ubiquinone biosynthesis protein
VVTQLQRFSQIIEILGRYGFGIAVEELFPGQQGIRLPLPGGAPQPGGQYERIRLAIEELGPAYVKFGQILATRTDVLPAELIAELKKLQDQVKPVPFDEVRPEIAKVCPVTGDCFSVIDEVPVASASIAQVHRAVLPDGTQVALKIQRPGIGDLIETDLIILMHAAERAEQVFPDAKVYNPTGMVKDFAHQIRRELDFRNEGRTAERMRENFSGVEGIRIPKIYGEYSSSRLLVMEYVEGVRIDDLRGIEAMGLDPKEIGARGFRAYLKMIFEDGFFHGDPHPGNLLVGRDGTIVVLDFGIYGTLRPEKRQLFVNFLFALLDNNTGLLVTSLEGLGIVIPKADRDRLQDDLFLLMQDLDLDSSISRFNFTHFADEMAEVMRRYRISVPANLMLVLKVLVMVLDIGVRLDPEFTIRRELSPYLAATARKNVFSPETAQRAAVTLMDTADAVLDLPRYLNLMLRRFSTGIFRLDLVENDLDAFRVALDRMSDKILLAFVIGSLVIGSSIVLRASKAPLPPVLELTPLLGYGAAILAGFYVVYHVIYLNMWQGRR